MEDLTIIEQLEWAQDPLASCGGQPVIIFPKFAELSNTLSLYKDYTKLTPSEIYQILTDQTKRFSACGGNFGVDRTSMIRKNPESGWQYILDLIA